MQCDPHAGCAPTAINKDLSIRRLVAEYREILDTIARRRTAAGATTVLDDTNPLLEL